MTDKQFDVLTAYLERICDNQEAAMAQAHAAPKPPSRPVTSGAEHTFPPYGKAKGQPIVGASENDLRYYAHGCERTLNDPQKSRWYDKERALLTAIAAEMKRQGFAALTAPDTKPSGGSGRKPPEQTALPTDDGADDSIPFAAIETSPWRV